MSDEQKLEPAITALANRIEEVDSDIVSMQGEIEDIEFRIEMAEQRRGELTQKMRRLEAMDERVVERLVTGSEIIKTPRMVQIEKTPTRGLGWDELRQLNAEYQHLADKAKRELADVLEEAIAS